MNFLVSSAVAKFQTLIDYHSLLFLIYLLVSFFLDSLSPNFSCEFFIIQFFALLLQSFFYDWLFFLHLLSLLCRYLLCFYLHFTLPFTPLPTYFFKKWTSWFLVFIFLVFALIIYSSFYWTLNPHSSHLDASTLIIYISCLFFV